MKRRLMDLVLKSQCGKKNYIDVRIIDQSASGLWEVVSDNLLEYL